MEVNVDTQTVGIGVGGALMALAGLRKVYLDWINSKPQVASATAISEQIETLRKTIEDQQIQIKELRTELTKMDVVLHRQQTKLTRTEMLLRQFVGLVKERGVETPKFMQDELDDLLATKE